MLRSIGKRILLTLATLLLISLIVFTLIRLVPGDPARCAKYYLRDHMGRIIESSPTGRRVEKED